MEIDNSLYSSLKYILGAMLSGIVSLFTWNHKRTTNKLDTLHKTSVELNTNYQVLQTELQGIKEDVLEIKQDLKKLLFK